jgi:hypothetical protein
MQGWVGLRPNLDVVVRDSVPAYATHSILAYSLQMQYLIYLFIYLCTPHITVTLWCIYIK